MSLRSSRRPLPLPPKGVVRDALLARSNEIARAALPPAGYHVWVFGERSWFERYDEAVSYARRAAATCPRRFIDVKQVGVAGSIRW